MWYDNKKHKTESVEKAMTNFLIKLFVHNYHDTNSPPVRERYGKLAGCVGIVCNVLLCAAKMLIGFLFSSIAIIADAVNNLSDAGSSIITLIGFKMSGKPADEEHPYGHARIEYISGLIISFVILLLGAQLILSSFQKILHPDQVQFRLVSVFVLLAAILAKLWLGLFYRKISRSIHSTTLRAASVDSFNDVYATSAVLIALLAAKFTSVQLDGYAGLIVAVIISISGIKLIKDTVNPLLGMMPDAELVNAVREKILSYDGVIGTHDLVVHNYGPGRCFASVHVEVPAQQDILVSHDIIDNIEKAFSTDLNINLVIHLDPIVTDDPKVNNLSELVDEILQSIDPVITKHDFRVVFGTTHTNLIFDITVPPGYKTSDQALSDQINAEVQAYDSSLYTVIMVDRSYISTVNKKEH